MKNKTNIFQRFFNLGFKPDAQSSMEKMYPTRKNEKGKYEKQKFPTEVQALWTYWMQQCHDSRASWANRMDLYRDMEALFYNSALISRAVDLYKSETIQADSNQRFINVEGKSKIRKHILEFINRTEIESKHAASTIHNEILFGDAGWVLSLGDVGIEEILPIDVFDFTDRIEFTPHQVQKELYNKQSVLAKLNNLERIRKLIDTIKQSDNHASYFKNYLFGFQVAETFVLPPWRFLHFRNFTSRAPFAPFGMPHFIRSVAPYRQYDAAMALQVMARGARFPRDLYKLNIPKHLSPTDQIDQATEFMRELDNSGLKEVKKEGIGIGEKIITIVDTWEYEQISSAIDLGRIEDIELMRDDIIISTGLPRNFLDPNTGSFGNSGISLIQQHKPFAREVYGHQSNFIHPLILAAKIDAIQSGKFSLDELEFTLSMPYPEAQTDRDVISSQGDLLQLANDILDSLGEKLMDGDLDNLPLEIVRDVYHQILPYDSERIDNWIKIINKNKEKVQTEEQFKENYLKWKKVKKAATRSGIRDLILETIHEQKKESLCFEGSTGRDHYVSSSVVNSDFAIKDLVELKKGSALQKMQEKSGIKTTNGYNTQYLKEVFKINKEKKEEKNEQEKQSNRY